MMGPRQVEQGALFYNFSIEAHVPADRLLRAIDRFVDLSDLRRDLAPFYSSMGRPSVDPELMIRMLVIGCCVGIRSERRLCEEVHLNLAYRWFCRLGLDGDVPDHSTLVVSAGAISCGGSLRRSYSAALKRAWSAAKSLRLMPASSRRMPTGKKASRARRGCRREPLAEPFRSIWLCSTMLLSAQRPRSRPSSSRQPIRQLAGLGLMVGKPSTLTPPII